MGRKKRVEPDDKEQSARFRETAERILSEDAEELFEDAVQRIILKKPTKAKEADK